LFTAEQERIFGEVWNLVCHECEIPAPGAYITRDVAGCPMIIARDQDGRLRAFYNTCRHRGSVVAVEPKGSCKAFVCPYHNWCYALDGHLTAVPGIESLAGTGFRKEDYGLIEARVDSLYGLVFVCQSDAAPSLAEFIGPELASWLYKPFALADLVLLEHRQIEVKANWKTNAENARDGYHVPNVHPFLKRASAPRPYHMFPGPHALQELSVNEAAIDEELWASMQEHPLPGLGPYDGYVAVLFPDTFVLTRSNFVEIETQLVLAPDLTIIEDRVYGLRGDTGEVREIRLKSWTTWVGNVVAHEDIPILQLQQRGLTTRKVPRSIIARQGMHPGGQRIGQANRGDDERLRQFWKHWRQMMGLAHNASWIVPDEGNPSQGTL
jgi:phenylpropionate dioxygenase-like ring-hydroxylating dioxygenase large terminal subunit